MGASGHLVRAGIVGAVVMAMATLGAADAGAAELPDASCESTRDSWQDFGQYPPPYQSVNREVAQTFTASRSGTLTRAQVQLLEYADAGSAIVEVRPWDGASAAPGSGVLASDTIPASEVANGTTPTTVSARFGPGAPVVGGRQYALVLRSTDGLFFADYSDSANSPCPGELYFRDVGWDAWGSYSSRDLVFSTFVDAAPEAANDSYSTAQDESLRVSAPGLLANDSDPAADALAAAKAADPAHGEVIVGVDGSFAYFPDEGYVGTDSFTYEAFDALGNTDAATVEIAVEDSTAPTVVGVSPRHKSAIRDATPTIKATVGDNSTLGKDNIELYVAGRLISADKYSYTASTGALVHNSPRLSSGKKTAKVVATDAAGNAFTKSWYFTIKR